MSCSSNKNIEDNMAVDIRCPGLDHGLANLINGFIYNKEFPQGQLSYFGFHKPHPLEDAIVFRLVLAVSETTAASNKNKALCLFQDHLKVLEEKLGELKGNLRGTTFPLRPPPGA
jgi:DNA-directed RNA polymerase subunit L